MFGGMSTLFGGSTPAFGGSQTQGQAETPEKRERQEDKGNCLPVTVQVLNEVIENRTVDGDIRFHGQEVGQVVLVAAVENLIKQPTSLEFVANDGTGRMKVRHYVTGEAKFDSIEEGRYVSMIGLPRTSPVHHLSVLVLRPVQHADEISYHTIEVAHAFLKLRQVGFQRPKASVPQLETPQPKTNTTGADTQMTPVKVEPAQMDMIAAVKAEPAQTVAPPTALSGAATLAFMRKECESRGDDGMEIAEICMNFQAGGASSDQVRAVVNSLIEQGEIFETIDEEHVACL